MPETLNSQRNQNIQIITYLRRKVLFSPKAARENFDCHLDLDEVVCSITDHSLVGSGACFTEGSPRLVL